MSWFEAVLYGLVQGLTEFLPISSTAHLRLLPTLLGKPDPGAAFTAVIQIGTLAAVLIYFRTDLAAAAKGWLRSLKKGRTPEEARAGHMGWAILLGTIPIVVLGIALEDFIKGPFRNLNGIAASLIGMGVLLAVADRYGKRNRVESEVKIVDGIFVGFWQAIALIPGASRSGSTITGALLAGFDRSAAARFSFLLSVPSIFGAGIKELIDERKTILGSQLTPAIIATLVSAIVGYLSIAFLLKMLQSKGLSGFVIYRIALGILLIIAINAGWIPATSP